MPLTTYHYTCGHTRRIQGRECRCVYTQLMRINDTNYFSDSHKGYAPFDYSNCHHNKSVYRTYDCRDCRHYRERLAAMVRVGERPAFWDRYRGGSWWYLRGR
ncbi:hypothetical protein M409DRAFT_68323 [Zasmidium cellare ATCC 36951]|uniref:Uncharacterized protein n=1 Tax=Zasmidium cellare ATCC 36951 TaxID=1080233 RepID=A0A6A6CE86_ZASCE|nr:uncharacterized protein M409DRAFT_68323 [Zasmidium cellare ATCC 36951]KAF2163736.1 hypothetical protein M409DRAFT_68323 [Zasmidium cellare ATCC 36951]